MRTILETPRLLLREMTQEDFGDLAQMLKDPEVMYAYEHDFSDEDVQVWLDRQRGRYEKYSFGLWAMVLKETGEMIGQAGLTMQPHRGGEVLEIGYLLKKKYWHCGYAREAAEAVICHSRDTLGIKRLCAQIDERNERSKQLAQRLGFTLDAHLPQADFGGRVADVAYYSRQLQESRA